MRAIITLLLAFLLSQTQGQDLCEKIAADVQRAAIHDSTKAMADGEWTFLEVRETLNDYRMWREMMANNGCPEGKVRFPFMPDYICQLQLEGTQNSICYFWEEINKDGVLTPEELGGLKAKEIMAIDAMRKSGCDARKLYLPKREP